MSPKSKREYFKSIAQRYQKASKNGKSKILCVARRLLPPSAVNFFHFGARGRRL